VFISKSKITAILGTLLLVAMTTGCKQWECEVRRDLTDFGCGTVEMCWTSDDTEAKFTYDGKDYICDGTGKDDCDAAYDEVWEDILAGCSFAKEISKADLYAALVKTTPGTCGGL